MMRIPPRRPSRPGMALVLILVAGTISPVAAADKHPIGGGPAYDALAQLPLMHEGRVKPLDTLARVEVKLIHGRESITLNDDQGKKLGTWGPVAAYFGWTSAPDFWDEQSFVLVEYLPLKQSLLAESVRGRLSAIADDTTAPAEARRQASELGKAETVAAEQLKGLVRISGLSERDRQGLQALIAQLGADSKYFSPRELEEARVTVDGRKVPFSSWANDLRIRQQAAEGPLAALKRETLSATEKKAIEVADRLTHYQNIRSGAERTLAPVDQVMPRPHNKAYITYAGQIFNKVKKIFAEEDPQARNAAMATLNPLQEDTANTVVRFLKNIQAKDRKELGTDADFDQDFADWLTSDADWISRKILLDTDPQELAEAGFPAEAIVAFRTSYNALKQAEAETPGQAPAEQAQALLSASQALGSGLGGGYPRPEEMKRETRFNAFAPFYRTPMAYGLGFLLLLLSLGMPIDARSTMAKLGKTVYLLGMLGLVLGIALEAYGFYARIRISGWAPVTNMYETVVWVGGVAAVLGLVLELVYRKRYPAAGAAGVAMLCTIVAASAGSTILDPTIKSIPPVLRSNYWLTIHVLTIVSSYAAFALAMGLGLIATLFYLVANYKRPVGIVELLHPVVVGAPLMAMGIAGYLLGKSGAGPEFTQDPSFALLCGILGLAGVSITLAPVPALVGEGISRLLLRPEASLDEASIAGVPAGAALLAAEGTSGGVATLERPSAAAIRASQSGGPPKQDARSQSMQQTAAVVKPLANYVYRAMQVGVLLVTAGTILGGWWADKSWGRFWGWDPKEVWALITLLVYLVPLHGRFAGWIGTWGLVAASVFCFSSVMMAWYGVNFVLGVGLHSYGFSGGGYQEAVGLTMAAVFSLVVAAGWRRHRGLQAHAA